MATLATNVILENSALGRAADRARLAHIKAQILDLERSLVSLHLEKDVVEKRLDSYRYPVLTLPNEITSEIFLQFLPIYPSCPPSTGLLSPTLLTHICRNWREIALATPALWRAIWLVFRDLNSDERNRKLLLPWMAASGSLPLSIRMHAQDLDLRLDECVETLCLYRGRWEYLHIEGITGPEVIFPFFSEPMPSLRHITFSTEHDPEHPGTFGDAPLLCSAILNPYPNVLSLPWIQLTRLTLAYVYPYECTPVLKQTKSLLYCELSLCGDSDTQPDVHLSSLQSLVFIDNHKKIRGYLETFIVPALRILHVPEEFLGTNPIRTLQSFISQSGCLLKELHIIEPVSSEEYKRAFADIPEVSFECVPDENKN
ncbi:hypothetical protein C8R43DRAFT_975383 [Mycena crocata]|nr:hypothetical protein C8R43DRAFT_975383 [Mycena crocata]